MTDKNPELIVVRVDKDHVMVLFVFVTKITVSYRIFVVGAWLKLG